VHGGVAEGKKDNPLTGREAAHGGFVTIRNMFKIETVFGPRVKKRSEIKVDAINQALEVSSC
jgi:hypothetical protein